MNMLRTVFARWRQRSFRDARATFMTVSGIATYATVILALVTVGLILLH